MCYLLLTNRIGRNFLINNPRIQPQANLKLLPVAELLCKHKERMKIYGRSDVMTIACFCLSLSITSCKKYRSFMFALVKHINICDRMYVDALFFTNHFRSLVFHAFRIMHFMQTTVKLTFTHQAIGLRSKIPIYCRPLQC